MDTHLYRRQCPCVPFPAWKRAIDVVAAAVGLVLLSPLFFLIAAAIKLSSSGPALFKQQRIGRHGKPFMLWKFRTMRCDANPTVHQAHLKSLIAMDIPMSKLDLSDDPRVFPFGKILRRCCLDELPQLVNVLRGEMSLAGPRPCMPYEAKQYKSWQKQRFDAMPGMTGLWQVSGKNKTTFMEMVRLDIAYANQVSFLLDLKILLKTVPAIVTEVMEAVARDKRRIIRMNAAAMRKDA